MGNLEQQQRPAAAAGPAAPAADGTGPVSALPSPGPAALSNVEPLKVEPSNVEPSKVEPPNSVEWAREYVYGTISTLVAIGGLTFEKNPDDLSVGWVIIVGALAIALAHAVSRLVVDWSKQNERYVFDHRLVVARVREAWPIVSAAFPATVVLVLAHVGLFSVGTALWVAAGVGVAALAVVGVVTASEPRHSLRRRVAYVVSLVAVGLFIVGLELLAHKV
ncbi:MAG TPA: hypothetical protein VHB02_04135 [Acidimicrobiales bacterium]|nr:hypothetical protein [Acidimicrobiales bacterium]